MRKPGCSTSKRYNRCSKPGQGQKRRGRQYAAPSVSACCSRLFPRKQQREMRTDRSDTHAACRNHSRSQAMVPNKPTRRFLLYALAGNAGKSAFLISVNFLALFLCLFYRLISRRRGLSLSRCKKSVSFVSERHNLHQISALQRNKPVRFCFFLFLFVSFRFFLFPGVSRFVST